MSKHSKIGIKGEQLAEEFLLNKGYSVLHRNWRSGRKEIDIIALQGEMLVIAEVKTRTISAFGFPEEAVTKAKQAHLKVAATAFSELYPQYKNIRFDIVSIIIQADAVKEIVHFEAAFY